MTQQAQIKTLQALQTEVNSLVTTYYKIKALKVRFNAKGWDVLQSKVTFDLNIIHDLSDRIEAKYNDKKTEFNAMYFDINRYVVIC